MAWSDAIARLGILPLARLLAYSTHGSVLAPVLYLRQTHR